MSDGSNSSLADRGVVPALGGVRIGTAMALCGAVVPGWARDRLSILMFHRVLSETDALTPDLLTADAFRWRMQLLREHFTVLPLLDGVERLRKGTLPTRAVSLTFDDGYADNASVALPILAGLGMSATFFVATGYLNGGRMWNDTLVEVVRHLPDGELNLTRWGGPNLMLSTIESRRAALNVLFPLVREVGAVERASMLDEIGASVKERLPDDLMMSDGQVRSLHAAGMEIGCHTHTHPILTLVKLDEAAEEIRHSRKVLEHIIGAPVRAFAFPNGVPKGDYDLRHVNLVRREGFEAAFSTAWGVATASSDPHQLPRFTPWDRTPVRFAARLVLSRARLEFPKA